MQNLAIFLESGENQGRQEAERAPRQCHCTGPLGAFIGGKHLENSNFRGPHHNPGPGPLTPLDPPLDGTERIDHA